MIETYATGISGFIGQHLFSHLPNITPIKHQDISTTTLEPYKRFFFLSAYGNMPGHTTDNDSMVLQANISDLIHVLNQTNFKALQSFVFMSTSSVKLPVQTMYSRTKNAAEQILLAFAEKYDAPIAIVRPFTVTGVGDQEGHLIPTLIRSCMTGKLINFVREPKHDFIDVEDVVNGLINLSDNHAKGIFELGTGKSYSNQEVLEIVEKVTGKKANVNIVPSMRAYDSTDWVSKNYKSRGWGWQPTKSLETSIKEMVEAYGKN